MSRLVDARGLRCPWPVLRLARAMREADDVTILADDPAASDEIIALAGANGWHVAPERDAWRVSKPCAKGSLSPNC